MAMKYNKLTPVEKSIIHNKHTEPPFTGKYDNFFESGIYICKQCNTPLFDSSSKFNSQCGWPAFDDELTGKVKQVPDSDGHRTEILCAVCEGHLGHIFKGEKLTGKNTRYCVNSASLRFIPGNFKEGEKHVAVLGGGCFWCLEAAFSSLKGIEAVVSGYSGGHKENPGYEEVCNGTTGHAEVIKIVYDHKIISFDQILNVFFFIHDPTTINRQGNDIGEQYRSVVFYKTLQQKIDTESFIERLENENMFESPIVTEVTPFIEFYEAEEYHQNYYEKQPAQGYCQFAISPKLSKLKDKFKDLLK